MSALSNWAGIAKRRYGDYINPLASSNTLADAAPFISQDRRPGENYNFPVLTQLEHGVTHNVDNTAFPISSVVDSVTKNAQLDGATILLQGNMPYDVVAKFMNPGATVDDMRATDMKVKGLMLGGELYRELALMYGPGTGTALANIGIISAIVSGANLAAPIVCNITRQTWAGGLWPLMRGALIDIYQSDGATLRAAEVTVSAVVAETNRLTLTKSGSTVLPVAGDMLIQRGAATKSCVGAQAILENTGSLFGIDAASEPVWRAVQKSAGSAALTIAKIKQLCGQLYNNGLRNGGDLFVNGLTFADLSDELDALERYNEPGGEAKRTGESEISIKSPAGIVKIKLHGQMKQGIAMFFAKNVLKRVGATDLTFSLGNSREWFYHELPSNAGSAIRIYSNQAIVSEKPYQCAIITAIQNVGDTSPA